MLTLFGFPLGTVFQGGTFAVLLMILGTVAARYVQGMPDRQRAGNESKALNIGEMETILADYAEQIKTFRAEVHGYRNELQAVRGELLASDKISSQRSDRINNMVFIIELLISELERLDPSSVIVKQAKAMLRHMAGGDPKKSEALNVAETAVADAKQTVRSAENTVVEISVNEAKGEK